MTNETLKDMAARLWAVATHMRTHNTDKDTMNACGEVCDDIAMVLAELAGTSYDDLADRADKETLQPTYKHSRCAQ